jgi:hypothetical protein
MLNALERAARYAVLLVLPLLTSCAYVSSAYTAELEPPEQYNHPYDGPVVERVMSEADVKPLCTSMGASPSGVACSWQSGGTCYIVLPNDYVLPNDQVAPVSIFRRHEIAHCNGWPANHPRDG